MSLISLHTYGPAEKLPIRTASGQFGALRLLHIGVHNSANRNAGDTLLFPVVRRTFDLLAGPFDWELRQAWEAFTVDDAEAVNREFDAIVLGGGGLLLRDQAGSDVARSGWQWNSSVQAVDAIRIPLIVFAIGYNRFRGQSDFDPVFSSHLRAVAAKSGFFGLRNTGSIRALHHYLTPPLEGRLRRQYCPTTVIWELYPQFRSMAEQHDLLNERVFAFNAAFDRAEHRFGENPELVLENLARAVRTAQDRGWRIVTVAHKSMDRQIEPYLDKAAVSYDSVDLTDASSEEIMAFYANVDFSFGMRGHAQMIPLGLRKPILSIISHDKMRFLLEDLGRPDWGVEIFSPDLAAILAATLQRVESDRTLVRAEVAAAQAAIWEETQRNLSEIDHTLLKAAHQRAAPDT